MSSEARRDMTEKQGTERNAGRDTGQELTLQQVLALD
jgi:hypothetical protein